MKLRSLMTVICVLATATIVSAAPFAYVANSGTKNVTVIDTADNSIKATVPLPDTQQTLHPYAYSVAVGASGQYAYIGLQTTNEVAVIDTTKAVGSANAVVKRISLGTDSPGGLAVNAAETRLYVASNMSNTLIVINISGTIPSEVGRVAVENSSISNPEGVILNPAGNKAYVANSSKGTIAEIALDETNNVYTRTALIALGLNTQPYGLAISSDGAKLYAASLNGNASVVNTATREVTNLTVEPDGMQAVISVAITPDNSKIYAPSAGYNNMYWINGVNNAVTALGGQNSLLDSPWGSSVAPVGSKLYVAMNLSDNVKVFNTSTNLLEDTITLPAGAKPTSMGDFIGPDMPWTITATDDNTNCAITPEGAIPVNSLGRTFTIAATPGPCKLKVDGNLIGVGETSYTFTAVDADHTIAATLAQYFTLTADWPAGGCYLVSTPQGTSPVGINAGSKTTTILGDTEVTIAASAGYSPIGWTGACAGTADGQPCTITVDAAKTFAVTSCGQAGGNVYNVTKGLYYATIALATTDASDGDEIKVSTAITAGETTGSSLVKVKMSGLWQSDYITQGTGSLALTITGVAVIANGLIL